MARKHATEPLTGSFADFGARQTEAYLETQSALTQQIEEANALWFKRLQTEGALASELLTNLAASRSVPEAATAWQHWITRHMELMMDDAKRASAGVTDLLNTERWAVTGKSKEQ
jgi:hypothetical protein